MGGSERTCRFRSILLFRSADAIKKSMETIVIYNDCTKIRTTVSLTLLAIICVECGGRNEPHRSTNEIQIVFPRVGENTENLKLSVDSIENEVRIKHELRETIPSLEESQLPKTSIVDEFISWHRQHEKFQIIAYQYLPWFSPLNDSYKESRVLFFLYDNVLHGCLKTVVEQEVSNNMVRDENELVCHRMPEGIGHIENIEAKVENDGSLTISFCAGIGTHENRKDSCNSCYRWQTDKLALRKYGQRKVSLDTRNEWIQIWSQTPSSKEWWPYKYETTILRCTSQEYKLARSQESVMSAVTELPMNRISWVSFSSEPKSKGTLVSFSDENNQEQLIVKMGRGWGVLQWERKNGLLKAWAENADSLTGLSNSIWLFYEWYDSGSRFGDGRLIAELYVPSENAYRKAGHLQLGAYQWERSSSAEKRTETIVRRSFDSFSVVEGKCIQMRVEARWSAKYPDSGNRRPVTNIKWMDYDFEKRSIVEETPQKGDIKLLHWTGKEFLPGCASGKLGTL